MRYFRNDKPCGSGEAPCAQKSDFRYAYPSKRGVIMFHVKILSKEDIMQVIEMQPVIQCVEDVYKTEKNEEIRSYNDDAMNPGHAVYGYQNQKNC